ncbi:MAG: hypothetical protein PHX61_02500 [Alphaproteobacteria bacterium]|nr:hypothetical protein [Alphaproteobacteria bacterium]
MRDVLAMAHAIALQRCARAREQTRNQIGELTELFGEGGVNYDPPILP